MSWCLMHIVCKPITARHRVYAARVGDSDKMQDCHANFLSAFVFFFHRALKKKTKLQSALQGLQKKNEMKHWT